MPHAMVTSWTGRQVLPPAKSIRVYAIRDRQTIGRGHEHQTDALPLSAELTSENSSQVNICRQILLRYPHVGAVGVESGGEARTSFRQDNRRVEEESVGSAVGDGELTARVKNQRGRGLPTQNAHGRTERLHGNAPTRK